MEFIVKLTNAELTSAVQCYLNTQSLGMDVKNVVWKDGQTNVMLAEVTCVKRPLPIPHYQER